MPGPAPNDVIDLRVVRLRERAVEAWTRCVPARARKFVEDIPITYLGPILWVYALLAVATCALGSEPEFMWGRWCAMVAVFSLIIGYLFRNTVDAVRRERAGLHRVRGRAMCILS
jgi:hypothetical protein